MKNQNLVIAKRLVILAKELVSSGAYGDEVCHRESGSLSPLVIKKYEIKIPAGAQLREHGYYGDVYGMYEEGDPRAYVLTVTPEQEKKSLEYRKTIENKNDGNWRMDDGEYVTVAVYTSDRKKIKEKECFINYSCWDEHLSEIVGELFSGALG